MVVVLYRLGQFQEALAALPESVVTNTAFEEVVRTYVLVELRDGPNGALREFQNAWSRNPSPFDALLLQTTLRLLGRKAQAVEVCMKLRERKALLPSWRNGWYHRLLDYNCDLLSGDSLLKAAGSSRWSQSEAHFFIGMTRLAEGHRAAAREHFRKNVAAGVFAFFDHDWSRAFLHRMEEDPNWPAWISVNPESSE